MVLMETSSSTSGTTIPSAGSICFGEFKGAAGSCMMVSRVSRQTFYDGGDIMIAG